jgi:hypothetical protein
LLSVVSFLSWSPGFNGGGIHHKLALSGFVQSPGPNGELNDGAYAPVASILLELHDFDQHVWITVQAATTWLLSSHI